MVLIFCTVVFSVQCLIAIVLHVLSGRLKSPKNTAKIDAVSVIIPFHNEEDRILTLIDSLNLMGKNKSVELIFVDDFSTDRSCEILYKSLSVPFVCIQNTTKKGKKWALRCGIDQAKHDTIITWDADISVPPQYFSAVFELQKADLHILPVNMTATGLMGKLGIIEFQFLDMFSSGFAGAGKPVLCHGANLCFSKTKFLVVDAFRGDYDTPSGDDLFLLRAMQQQGGTILFQADTRLAVGTPAPRTFKQLVRQRRRWFGKMDRLVDFGSFFGLALVVLVQLAWVLSLFQLAYNPLFLAVLGLKFIAEFIAVFPLISRNISFLFVLTIHQCWYPFYLISLVLPWSAEKRWLPKSEFPTGLL